MFDQVCCGVLCSNTYPQDINKDETATAAEKSVAYCGLCFVSQYLVQQFKTKSPAVVPIWKVLTAALSVVFELTD